MDEPGNEPWRARDRPGRHSMSCAGPADRADHRRITELKRPGFDTSLACVHGPATVGSLIWPGSKAVPAGANWRITQMAPTTTRATAITDRPRQLTAVTAILGEDLTKPAPYACHAIASLPGRTPLSERRQQRQRVGPDLGAPAGLERLPGRNIRTG